MPVCLLAACVCACHSEGVWVRMSVCHVERVSVSVCASAHACAYVCVLLPLWEPCVRTGCVTETN